MTEPDIVNKSKNISGFKTPYIPGWDCHGLPIEINVEKKINAEDFVMQNLKTEYNLHHVGKCNYAGGTETNRKFSEMPGILKGLIYGKKDRVGKPDLYGLFSGNGKIEDLIFIEVKTRHLSSFGYPEESVNSAKQSQIRRVARGYLLKNTMEDVECRFDVLTLTIDDSRSWSINHIKNAF